MDIALNDINEKFRIALMISVFVHIIALIVYGLSSMPNEIEIPFIALKIKLGDIRFDHSDAPHIRSTAPSPEVTAKDKKKSHAARRQTRRTAVPAIIPQKPVMVPRQDAISPFDHLIVEEKENELQNILDDLFTQEMQTPLWDTIDQPPSRKTFSNAARGSVLGNKAIAKDEITTSYGQRLSLWLQKHKIYPPSADRQGWEGRALVSLQISRDGNILHYKLLEKTKYDVLDRAVLDMVRDANPAPPFPDDFPAGDIQIFNIWIDFIIE